MVHVLHNLNLATFLFFAILELRLIKMQYSADSVQLRRWKKQIQK